MMLLGGHQKNTIPRTNNLDKSRLVALLVKVTHQLRSLVSYGMKPLVIIMMPLQDSITMGTQVCSGA